MSVMHTWALIMGAVAVAVPVAVHLLTKPRPVRLPVSTLRFIRGAVQQRAARNRLRDWLVLLLRSVAVILIALALARPVSEAVAQFLTPSDQQAAVVRVVVLDVSQSMAAESGGIAAVERARLAAEPLLQSRRGLMANLVLSAASSRPVFDRFSSNFTAMRQELATCQALPQTLNVPAMLNTAAELLATSAPEAERELVIVSDFQRTNWSAANWDQIPAGVRIHLESVAPETPPENLGLLRVGTRGRASVGRDVTLEVEVGNFSRAARRVEVEVDFGSSTYRLSGTCPPGVATTLSQSVAVREAGWQIGEARLVNAADALAADNVRPLAIEVAAASSSVLVSREPPGRRPSSSYFLERAIAPYGEQAAAARSVARVRRLDPRDFEADAVAATDLIVLCRPGKLSDDQIRLLAALLRRGRSVLYSTSEPVDATNLKLLATAVGDDWTLPVEFLPPPSSRNRQDWFLVSADATQPPFAIFGDQLAALLGEVRVTQALSSRATDRGLRTDVLASYHEGSAAVVVSGVGLGSLAILNADLASSSLPRSHGVFVPMVGELVERLLEDRRGTRVAASGEPFVVDLPAEVRSMEGLAVRPPLSADAAEDLGGSLGVFADAGLGVVWQTPAAGTPGVYRVEQGGPTVYALAVGLPSEESDLRPIAAEILTERLAGDRPVTFHAAAQRHSRESDTWVWLAVGCLACLLGELIVLRVFRT